MYIQGLHTNCLHLRVEQVLLKSNGSYKLLYIYLYIDIYRQWRNKLVGGPWTSFSWGPLVLLDRSFFNQKFRRSKKKFTTQSFAETLLLDRSFFNKITRGGSPGQVKKICNSVFCEHPSPAGQVVFQAKKLGVLLLN